MAAAHQPVDADFSSGGNWLSLVRDQGYRLFAAGNGRAVIVERLPHQPGTANQRHEHPGPRSFDARYGLNQDSQNLQKNFVLLTEVSRSSEAQRPRAALTGAPRGLRSSPWNAVRSIQPVNRLESYVSKEAGNLLFFLVRGAKTRTSLAPSGLERLDASAVHIAKTLGLSERDLDALRVAGLARESTGETPSIDSGEGNEPACCKFPECGSAPAASLEGQSYCKEHFISTSYERLDSCSDQLSRRPVAYELSDRLRSFLTACIHQANALTRAPFNQDPLERARLLDIRYTAMDLCSRLRRSPRLADSRPVRLLCETPGHPWQEVQCTSLISRFGAMLECNNLVRPDDWLWVERLDTGTRVRARLAWRETGKSGSFSVGLEFLDSENFWGLTWPDPAPSRADGGRAPSLFA